MQDYNTIIGAIQMRQNGCSFNVIEGRYGIGSGTVQRILKRFRASGLTLDEQISVEPSAVEDLFYPKENLQRIRKSAVHFDPLPLSVTKANCFSSSQNGNLILICITGFGSGYRKCKSRDNG